MIPGSDSGRVIFRKVFDGLAYRSDPASNQAQIKSVQVGINWQRHKRDEVINQTKNHAKLVPIM